MKEKIKAVLFDFDDTLSDREAAFRLFALDFSERHFPAMSAAEREKAADDMEELVDGGYMPREKYFPLLFERWQWHNHPPLDELCADFNENFGRFKALLPDSVPTLEALRKKGYVLGIISNGISVLQNMKLDTAEIRGYFDFILISGDCEFNKPDKQIFLMASEALGLSPCECVFVGDHPINDIEGALGAGMNPVRMNFGTFKDKGLSPDVPTIGRLAELLDIL